MAQRAAPTDLTVLIQGESGTGKELVARAIHALSRTERGPFVAVNCAPFPRRCSSPSCSATSAAPSPAPIGRSPGRFELADGGTLFLDEIGELPRRHAGRSSCACCRSGEIERVGGASRIARRRPHHRRDEPRPRGRWSRAGGSARTSSTACSVTLAPAAAARARRRHARRSSSTSSSGRRSGCGARPHGDAGGDAVPLDVPVAGQCPGAAAHARGGDGALRRRHHARAPAGRHPEQWGAVAAGSGPDHEARGRLARRHAGGERAPHDPRRARQGRGRAGAGGQDPRIWSPASGTG